VSATYKYKVVEVSEGLIGGKMSGEKLEKILMTMRAVVR
jgi:hypothetical protein